MVMEWYSAKNSSISANIGLCETFHKFYLVLRLREFRKPESPTHLCTLSLISSPPSRNSKVVLAPVSRRSTITSSSNSSTPKCAADRELYWNCEDIPVDFKITLSNSGLMLNCTTLEVLQGWS